MQSLQQIGQWFVQYWKQLSPGSRVLLLFVVGLTVCSVAGLTYYSTRPQWVPLITHASPGKVAEFLSALEGSGIPHRLNAAGTGILVTRPQWNRARLLLGEEAGPAVAQGLALEESLFSDPTLSKYHVLRHREETLARTIERFPAVANATVHLGQPEWSPFVRDRSPPTASVVLELNRGVPFSQEQALSIVTMLANGVEGLTPDNITVIDTQGRVLAAQGALGGGDTFGQLEYRRRIEADLAAKACAMLEHMLGPGRAVVRVTADVDFTRSQRQEKTYDPELKVRTREKIRTVSRKGNTGVTGITAGMAANLGQGRSAQVDAPSVETEEENDAEYETGYTVDTVTQLPGKITRLTIAAMVSLPNPTPTTDDPMAATTASGPSVTREQIEALIKQAVGFHPERGDQIEVVQTEMLGTQEIDRQLAVVQKWERYQMLARDSSLGLASLVGLILGWLTLRKLRPLSLPQATAGVDRERRLRVVSELTQKAHENPEVIKAVVASWLNSGATQDGPRSSQRKAPDPGPARGSP